MTNQNVHYDFWGPLHFDCRCLKPKSLSRSVAFDRPRDKKWAWIQEPNTANRKLKRLGISERMPVKYDPNCPLVLSYDGSRVGIGTVLPE